VSGTAFSRRLFSTASGKKEPRKRRSEPNTDPGVGTRDVAAADP
jgi:hypothetical protein